MNKPYDRNYFLFRHTDTQRTLESFKAFTEGLFGSSDVAQAEPIPEKDLLLRPYDYCDSWEHQYSEYKDVNSESYKFKHSELWNRTLSDISTRLG